MPSKVSQVSITRFIKKMDRLEAFVSTEAYDALDQIGQEAVDFMRQRVTDQSIATGFSLDAQEEGINRGTGRTRTGRMYESINYRETSIGGGEVGSRLSIEFGYLNAPPSKKYPNISYAQMQEEGFVNKWVWSRPLVKNRAYYARDKPKLWHITPGMFAFRDAKDYVRNIVRPQVASDAARKIAARMRGV